MLDTAVTGAKLNALLDAVLSVEEVGVYKPHPKVYGLAVGALACRIRHRLSVVECVGCLCGIGLRHAGRLM